MATDAAAAAPPVEPEATHASAEAEAEAEVGEAGEAGAALGPDGEPAGASPFRLADATEWRVCAPWDARVLLTRAELDALLLPAKRKGVYSAADYE